MYQLQVLPKFERQFKKFYPKEQYSIKEQIRKILDNPLIGEQKKGALSYIKVLKFKIHHQLYLLAYEQDGKGKIIYLYAIATHENFYDNLQNYLK